MTVITPFVSQWNMSRPPVAPVPMDLFDKQVTAGVLGADAPPIDVDERDEISDIDYARLRFLIVDDSRFCRTLIKNALAAYRINNVVEAADATDALETLQTTAVDFVLVDFEMPGSDGVELTRRIRWSEQKSINREVPIIMISRHTDKSIVVAARNAGIHEFIGKPVAPTELFKRIRATLEQARPFIRSESYRGPDRRWIDRDD